LSRRAKCWTLAGLAASVALAWAAPAPAWMAPAATLAIVAYAAWIWRRPEP